jgi:NAD(P)H-nitrite reductase large subunit
MASKIEIQGDIQFVVIGNGIAGATAAATIRRLNKKARITIISEEPHPVYSACVLANYLSGEVKRQGVFIKSLRNYQQENISLISSQKAMALDVNYKRVVLTSGHISYDKLIIAAGSKPAIPNVKGKECKGVFTFKSLNDADMISQWDGQIAVVVGSGPIGMEISLALRKKGYRVVLVELLNWVLPHVLDEYPASIIKTILEKGGIKVLTQEKLVQIVGIERTEAVITDKRKIKCDTVILAAGVRPEVGLVAGILELGKLGGISVDERMGTSIQDVYACGDCIEVKDLVSGYPALNLLWHNARQQGEVAGYNAAGIPCNYPGSLNLTGVELFGTQVFSFGSTVGASQDGLEVIEREKDGRYQRLILSNEVLVGAQSINWSENMAMLLNTALRQEKVQDVRDLFVWRKPLHRSAAYFPFGRKTAWNHKLYGVSNQVT